MRRFKQLAQERYTEYARRLEANMDLGDYAHTDHPLPGYVTSDAHWRLENGIELGYGRKPPDGKDDTMSGIHARYVLAVGDEAVGLSEALITDLGNLTGNDTSRRLLVANPTNPLSYMAQLFKMQTPAWAFRTISVFDSPNFHGGEGLPKAVLESLVDQTYVDDRLADWGSVTSPKYLARILGEFAYDQGATLISEEDMAIGLETECPPLQESRPVLGVDVSRSEHGDMNTVYSFEAGRLRFIAAWNDKNAMRTAEKIHEFAMECGATEVRIDSAGLGGPIADRVAQLSRGHFTIYGMLGGGSSPNVSRWQNLRAYWYWNFGEMLRGAKLDIDLEDSKLQEELLGIEYKLQTHGLGALLIESKDDMRKRGVGSPDYADAAIYAAADMRYLSEGALAGKRIGDVLSYDPFDMVGDMAGYPI